MNILTQFRDLSKWTAYLLDLESKEDFLDKTLIKDVKKVIAAGIESIDLDFFPLPTKKEVKKHKTSKKRIVYLYPEPYNTYLKMINWLLQNNKVYASQFCTNSYAYQKNKSVRNGILRLQKELNKNNRKQYLKSDFSDYFNSIDLNILVQKMKNFFHPEDYKLMNLFIGLLNEPSVYVNKKIIEINNKGVMAGTPISGYLANIYMNEVDWEMYSKHIYYIRYADDVFILTNKPDRDLELFNNLITPLKIKLNESKTSTGQVRNGFTVLGFSFKDNEIDIDEAKILKMMNRIKRRSKWFRVWAQKKNIKNEVMVRTFIKGMNAKLYSGDEEDRLNWSRWYFANINTVKSLERIDAYLVQYIRYLISGKQLGYKQHSEVSYEYVKKLGFKSLVNSYWRYKKKGEKEHALCN